VCSSDLVLIENHSLKPYEQRVLGTYVLLEAAMRRLAADGTALRNAIAADSALRPAGILANFTADPTPAYTRTFKGIRYEMYDSPASGRQEIRWLGVADPEPWSLPFYGSRPTLTLQRPNAYWVPGHRADIIERLRLHGIHMETLPSARTVTVDMLRLNEPRLATRANEGRVGVTVTGVTPERHDWTFPVGSVRVPTDQPLGADRAPLTGSTGQILDDLRALAEAGLDHLAAGIGRFGDISYQASVEALDMVASDILPELRRL
jgi:hypothetical protein